MISQSNNGLPSAEEIVERGSKIYNARLRQALEPQHNGEYVVIHVESGEYELDRDHVAALDRAVARWPHAVFYSARVGSRTIGRVGGHMKA